MSTITFPHSSTITGKCDTRRNRSDPRNRPLFNLFSSSRSPSTPLCLVMVSRAPHSSSTTCGITLLMEAELHASFPTPRQHKANKDGSKYRDKDATAVTSVIKVFNSCCAKHCSLTITSRQLYIADTMNL